ncbi:hypothetical protein [Aminobacter aminovorans]|uniref:hypothetical protein n=1 Tax=Aminobacter aminovorans TaxID=83263 RepID=UPI00285E15FF|nr:hypothetical protein [Aminobacter aminovorans]MDR7220577.1 hypothetical protein [Aminobacter aminovorans]
MSEIEHDRAIPKSWRPLTHDEHQKRLEDHRKRVKRNAKIALFFTTVGSSALILLLTEAGKTILANL